MYLRNLVEALSQGVSSCLGPAGLSAGLDILVVGWVLLRHVSVEWFGWRMEVVMWWWRDVRSVLGWGTAEGR